MAWQGFSAMLHLQTPKALQHWWDWCKCAVKITSNPPSWRCLTYWGSTWGLSWSRSRRNSQWGWGHTRCLPVPCPHATCACPARQKGLSSQCSPGTQMAFANRPCKSNRKYLDGDRSRVSPKGSGIFGCRNSGHWCLQREDRCVLRFQTSGLSKSLFLGFSKQNLALLILPWQFLKRYFCQS